MSFKPQVHSMSVNNNVLMQVPYMYDTLLYFEGRGSRSVIFAQYIML